MNNTRICLKIVTAAFLGAFLLVLWLAVGSTGSTGSTLPHLPHLPHRGTLPVTITRLYAFPHGDSEVPGVLSRSEELFRIFRKVGHFLLMGLLSFLVNLTLARTRMARQKTSFSWRNLLLASLVLSVIVTIEEFSQVL